MYTSIECGSSEKNSYMITYDNIVADLNYKESPKTINKYIEPFDRTKPYVLTRNSGATNT